MVHWSHRVLNFALISSISMGTTEFRIDWKRRLLIKSKWVRAYVLCYSTYLLLWMPEAIRANLTHDELFGDNPLAWYANVVIMLARLMALIASAVTRRRRDAKLEVWLQAVLQMQRDYFDRFREIPRVTTHRKWLFMNFVLMFVHSLATSSGIWVSMSRGEFVKVMDLYMLCYIVMVQHLHMLHHAAMLCNLRECFSVVRQQLRLNYSDPKMGLIYLQLCTLSRRLSEIYSPVMLCLQICLVLTNSMMGYVTVLAKYDPRLDWSIYGYLFGSPLYVLLLIHMYMYFVLCDWSAAMVKETDVILFESPLEMFDQELEKLCLNRAVMPVQVNVFNMFVINSKTLFAIIAQTVFYSILLIQAYLVFGRHK